MEISAQTSDAQKEKTVTMEDKKTITTFHMDNKKVSQRAFKKFLSNLTQVEGTWQCTKTRQGGITSYDAKDKEDIVYHYEIRQETSPEGLEKNTHTLTKAIRTSNVPRN